MFLFRPALFLYQTLRTALRDAWVRGTRDLAVVLWRRSYTQQAAAAKEAELLRYRLCRYAWRRVAECEGVELTDEQLAEAAHRYPPPTTGQYLRSGTLAVDLCAQLATQDHRVRAMLSRADQLPDLGPDLELELLPDAPNADELS